MELLGIIIWSLVWGLICKAIGEPKGINGFWWGFFLGFIGCIIILCMGDKRINPQQTIVVGKQNQNNVEKYEQLEKIAKLKEQGALSDSEYEREKAKLLNG